MKLFTTDLKALHEKQCTGLRILLIEAKGDELRLLMKWAMQFERRYCAKLKLKQSWNTDPKHLDKSL